MLDPHIVYVNCKYAFEDIDVFREQLMKHYHLLVGGRVARLPRIELEDGGNQDLRVGGVYALTQQFFMQITQ